MIRTFEDKNSFLCAAHPTVADLATAAKSALLRENSGAPRLWTCGGGLTAGFSTTTATIEMVQLLRIFSNWITKHTWMQKKSIVQEQSWKMPPQTSHQLRLHRMRYGERCMKTLKRTCTICMLPGCLGTTQGEGCQSASDPPSVRSGLCTN